MGTSTAGATDARFILLLFSAVSFLLCCGSRGQGIGDREDGRSGIWEFDVWRLAGQVSGNLMYGGRGGG